MQQEDDDAGFGRLDWDDVEEPLDEGSRMDIEPEETTPGRYADDEGGEEEDTSDDGDSCMALHAQCLLTTSFWVLARPCPLP